MACYFPTYPKATNMNNPQHNPDRYEQDNLIKEEDRERNQNQQKQQQQTNNNTDNKGLTASELPDSTNENKGSMGSGQRQDSN